MVQFYDGDELFQFPVVVIVSRNQAREAVSGTGYSLESPVCEYKNQEVEVATYDMNLNPVESRISFECLRQSCNIGETQIASQSEESGIRNQESGAVLVDYFPQCLNGYVVAEAEGYVDAKYLISTNVESVANIVMKKKYNLSLDLGDVDSALVSFDGEDYSAAVMYPYSKSIELAEDYYNVSVYVYENSTLKFVESTRQECVEVPSGALGLLGITSEECYDITIPAFEIDNAIVGGGKSVDYVLDSELKNSNKLNLEFVKFSTPSSLEDLQYNYELVEVSDVYLSFEYDPIG